MKYFTVDPRDGGLGAGGSCNTCCCQTIVMRPDETDKMIVNYAPWSVPIGGQGLVQGGTTISTSRDSSACPSGPIDGFGPPNFPIQQLTSISGAPVVFNVGDPGGIQPTGNSFTSRPLLLSGPKFGSITPTSSTGPLHTYTYIPNAGFFGTDVIWFEVTDAQGRTTTRPISIKSTDAPGVPAPNPQDAALGLYVDRLKMLVDPRMHTLSFPIHLGPDARMCDKFKLEIVQTARDCDYVYSHYSCFDIIVGKC